MNDDQLKQLLAKMLPETVHFSHSGELCLSRGWRDSYLFVRVLDTQLLHLCSLVEERLTDSEYITFAHTLNEAWMRDVKPPTNRIALCRSASATWQQRTTALALVKGVTL